MHSHEWPYYIELEKRGLTQEGISAIYEKRGINLSNLRPAPVFDDGNVAVFPFHRNGVVCLFKCRILNTPNMWCVSNRKEDEESEFTPFYNQLNFHDKSYLIITEGEFDAIAAMSIGITNVISLPFGGGRSVNGVNNKITNLFKREFSYLNQFKEIYIAFDMDETGHDSAEAARQVIGDAKYRRIYFSDKDLNDVIKRYPTFNKEDFLRLMANAEKPIRKTVLHASEFDEEELFKEIAHGYPTPFPDFDRLLGGLRPGEVTTITADTASGKTTFALNLCYHFANNSIPVHVMSHEMSAKKIMLKLGSIVTKKSLRNDECNEQDKIKFRKWRENCPFYYNPHGDKMTLESIIEDMEYARAVYDVKVFLMEDLNFLACKNKKLSEREVIDTSITVLRNKMRDIQAHLLLIVHPKQLDERESVDITKLKGSSGIKQISDNVLVLQRMDRVHPSNDHWKGKVKFSLRKNRELGREGEFFLQYIYEHDSYIPVEPILIESPL